eukprot:CAMPEP_0181033248 /NCGR_PEP_ID=MMETSP1070-20121207/7156_1 /TAXON_ID=265543 /ORGANISM="Minutocellus polymorphus, Strain NH13" /LENGTH=266 /DNA_ID=CAMNT_0023110663 /DNA_START=145 /DNA_END=942 /DNA_ORIENTATION=+
MISISSQPRRAGYVTTYQPVWGDPARNDREERKKAAGAVVDNSVSCNEPLDGVIDLRGEQILIAAGGALSTKSIPKPIGKEALGGTSKAAALRAKKAESVQSIASSNTNTIDSQPTVAVSSPVANPADNEFLKWARGEEGPKDAGTFIAPKSLERDQAKTRARGNATIEDSNDLGTGTFVGTVSSSETTRKTPSASKDFVLAQATDTFRPMARTDLGLQQSDSFEGSELKKQVGLNDNLSAALASLGEGDDNGNGRTESMAAAEAG